jgi:cysteine desulfurase
MNLDEAVIEGSLRIGLGKFTSEAEIAQAADLLGNSIAKISQLL